MDKSLYPLFQWEVIIHPRPNFNGDLTKLQFKLGNGWLVTHHCLHEIMYACPYRDAGLVNLC